MNENADTITITGDDRRKVQLHLRALVDGLIKPRHGESETESEKWGQWRAEVAAGKEYVTAPAARKDILAELLGKPLGRIAEEAPAEEMRRTAREFLKWYSAQHDAIQG
jgi:hypothetical protein